MFEAANVTSFAVSSPRDNRSDSLAGKRVLICEDEGVTLMALRRSLRAAGLVIVGEAANGAQGVEIALREKPDIVLMDVHMPSMRGTDAARIILDNFDTCLVFLTAFGTGTLDSELIGLPFCGHLTKPVDGLQLTERLAQIYANRKPAP